MITDTTALQEIRDSWKGVEVLRARIEASSLGSFATGGHFVIFMTDAAHNLPFVHACAVLNDALEQLRDEGKFRCGKKTLGALVQASKNALRWSDLALIEEVVEKRNGIAHYGAIVPRGDCWRYIDAIKAELQGWHIL